MPCTQNLVGFRIAAQRKARRKHERCAFCDGPGGRLLRPCLTLGGQLCSLQATWKLWVLVPWPDPPPTRYCRHRSVLLCHPRNLKRYGSRMKSCKERGRFFILR